MKMEQTECSETLAYKIQTPKNYPEESIQHSEHGENSKSRIFHTCLIHSHCARTCEFTYKIYLLLQYIQLHLAVKLVMQSQKLLWYLIQWYECFKRILKRFMIHMFLNYNAVHKNHSSMHVYVLIALIFSIATRTCYGPCGLLSGNTFKQLLCY